MLIGCAVPRPGEFGDAVCSNHKDDDRDGLRDCADPDCFGAEVCRISEGATPDAGTSDAGGTPNQSFPRSDATTMDAAQSNAGRKDAAASDAGGSSSPDSSIDAATIPAACVPACDPTQECVAGQCRPIAAQMPGSFALTILSVTAPDMSRFSQCYDPTCLKPLASALCRCPIDPYVRVVLVPQVGSESIIGMTTPAVDSPQASFSDAPFKVVLMPGDVLRFEVWDSDTAPDVDDKLYECKPDLSNVMPGPLSCTAMAGVGGLQKYSVSADLAALP